MISSNNQTDNWQAQDRHFRQLYAATTLHDFLKASAAAAALVGGGATATATVEAGKGGKRAGGSTLVSPLVLQPHLGLMDVLENHTCFTYQVIDVSTACFVCLVVCLWCPCLLVIGATWQQE